MILDFSYHIVAILMGYY